MRKIISLLVIIILTFTLTACSGDTGTTSNTTSPGGTTTPTGEVQNTTVTYVPVSVEYDGDDLDSSWDGSQSTGITLAGDSVAVQGEGVTVDNSVVTIVSGGTYVIAGSLDDGQIIVNTEDTEAVRLVLNGVAITCSTSAPIYVINAEKTVITLADGTENYLTDGDAYILEDAESEEPNAAIFSKDDLTINGDGSLTVNASYNNGIQSKDDLIITGGNITVNAANNGIKGKDCIAISDGIITVNAGGDGMQSSNGGDAEKGFVAIEGGTINITAGEDGIQAETSVLVSAGDITISSGGGSANSSTMETWGDWGPGNSENDPTTGDTSGSAKGIKAGVDVTIQDGNITIDSSDDSLHSNGSLTIDAGDIALASGDDGIHADATLEINGGDIAITKSYEGMESSVITVNDGTIHIAASDDGINAAGGVDGSSINGRPGQNNFGSANNNYFYLNGGYIYIDASGDGIDINGTIEMTGGFVIVNGPTNNANGALDYLGSFTITGGFMIAVGSSGMAQAPGTSSTQYSVMINFSTAMAAGTLFHIENETGDDILSFVPTKAYQSVLFSSPELENGAAYSVYSGGSSTGTVTDGLYSGGTYTAGTQIASLTVSSIVTASGASGGTIPGNMPDGGGHGGRR